MKLFDQWLYRKVRDMWDNKDQYSCYEEQQNLKNRLGSKMQLGTAMVEPGRPEGDDRISFELSTAIGGRIVNVRRYDTKQDRHNSTTYVIPNGEDVGSRVAKIINIELIK